MRCFVSVEVGEEARKKLSELQQELRELDLEASFAKPEQMHFTLAFLGEISEEAAKRKIADLEKIEFEEFQAELRGIGFFPSSDFIRVIWAGCESNGKLEELRQRAWDAVAKGTDAEKEKKFEAHATLARLKGRKNTDGLLAWAKDKQNEPFGTFSVSSIEFKQSVLGGATGAEHKIIGRALAKGKI